MCYILIGYSIFSSGQVDENQTIPCSGRVEGGGSDEASCAISSLPTNRRSSLQCVQLVAFTVV